MRGEHVVTYRQMEAIAVVDKLDGLHANDLFNW